MANERERIVVRRPEVFFRADGLMPETVKLDLTVLEVFGHLLARPFRGMRGHRAQRETDHRTRYGLACLRSR